MAAVNKDTQNILLTLIGVAIIRISLTGEFLRYVREPFLPILVSGGGLVMLLGIAGMIFDGFFRKSEVAAHAADHEVAPNHDHHGHDHDQGPRVAWLLLLPIAAIFLVAPPALGSFIAERSSGTVAQPASSEYPPLPPGDPVDIRVATYAERAVWDQGRTLTGRTVNLLGFVTPGKDGSWYLTRILITCCAADGRAYKIEVKGAPAPPKDSWVQLTGTYVKSDIDGIEAIPAIKALNVEVVPAPDNPYE